MNLVPTALKEELALRWQNLRERMQLAGADACLVCSNVNIYYYAGRIINGYIYFSADAAPLFLVRRPIGLEGEGVRYIRKVEQIPEILSEEGLPQPETLMLEDDNIFYGERSRCAKAFGNVRTVNASPVIRDLRKIKSPYEIMQMRESARLQTESLRLMPQLYAKGMTDRDLTIEIEYTFRKKGSLGMFRIFGPSMEAFMGQTLAGDNAAAPSPYDFALGGAGEHPSLPVGDNGTLLTEGMAVMVDMNGNFTGYIADQSRTFSIGRLSDKAYYSHQVSLEIHDELQSMGRPGVACEELYHKAIEIAKRHSLQDFFMGTHQQAKFVGHGVGLVINEMPVLCDRNKEPLEKSEIIAIEPKIIVEGTGAVGIENTYLVTESGLENLTTAPTEIIDLTV